MNGFRDPAETIKNDGMDMEMSNRPAGLGLSAANSSQWEPKIKRSCWSLQEMVGAAGIHHSSIFPIPFTCPPGALEPLQHLFGLILFLQRLHQQESHPIQVLGQIPC